MASSRSITPSIMVGRRAVIGGCFVFEAASGACPLRGHCALFA
jgi:hypothetical protein